MSSKISKFLQSLTSKPSRKNQKAEERKEGNKEELPPNDPVPPQNLPEVNSEEGSDPRAISRARRLTIVEDSNTLFDTTDLVMDIEPKQDSVKEEAGFVGVFAGRTQKGYVPYNPHKVNQDWMLIKDDVASGTLILGTFDGHGEHGHCVSEFICTSFYNNLIAHSKFLSDVKTAALEALQKAEEECVNSPFLFLTLTRRSLHQNRIQCHLYTFNVGDSRAILASEVNDECIVTELTHDHKPSLPEEKARIENAGGRVFSMEYEDGYDGPVRVWLADQDIPGLAMSRSLCDTVAHSVGVISTPEVCERTLTDDDRVIVMGSDGLWEFIPSEEVIHLIEDCEQPEVGEGEMMERRKRWSGCLRSRGSGGLMRRKWWTTRRLLLCF
ncbi:uncharacterized protein [Blastocystis hominis]|uniref:PPM-type phosphatase domain-containing protein n=1 Tax=Blastocystis hominis TaxID=12968 RepID=D8LVS6_BLAHO|nr:uncharacterized protein [Blastocystis hominis]CBK19915.2 unnamed protein product [Blastocystis hominis]|eukprot:XP_012893963.1 uncharacterized protein [Blastocystis hominis]